MITTEQKEILKAKICNYLDNLKLKDGKYISDRLDELNKKIQDKFQNYKINDELNLNPYYYINLPNYLYNTHYMKLLTYISIF